MKRNLRTRGLLVAILALVISIMLYLGLVLPGAERRNIALIQTTYSGQEPKALALLKQGADANLRFDAQTRKPLPSGFWERMGLRLRGKAQAKDAESVSLLSLAAAYSRKTLLEELLARGAKVDDADGKGSTALMYAVDHNDRDILIDLINAHADVNHKNAVGNTPLHLAVAQRNAVNCALLLDYGANPNLADAQGQTPLDDLAVMAAEIHRDWLAEYISASAPSPAKPNAPAAASPGVVLPSRTTPDMVTRLHQQQLKRLRALVSLLQAHGAVMSDQTKTLLQDSFTLDPQEAQQGLALPQH